MNQDIARLIAVDSFRAGTLLTNLVPILKEHLPEDEYQYFLKAIAECSAQIGETIVEKALSQFPELRDEIDNRVNTYGRFF